MGGECFSYRKPPRYPDHSGTDGGTFGECCYHGASTGLDEVARCLAEGVYCLS